MIKLICLSLLVIVALAEKPEFGSQHCRDVLASPCDGYPLEQVCAFDGKTHITYNNSCEFAHGICTHHGHSLHAEHSGPCTMTTTAAAPATTVPSTAAP